MSRGACLAVVVPLVLAAAPAVAQPAEPSVEYVVKPDDTCLGIAVRVLGDRNAVADIHRLNPGLGPLPHILRPGKLMRLPRKKDSPDARLTGKSGDVRVRKATETAWDAGKRGMDLFRAWRVAAGERASAEVTFSDTKRLFLREHTIVVIYGPQLGRARVTVNEATLESGTLRTRLAELSGGGEVKVTTPSAVATVAGGNAIISVGGDGASTVANHRGRAVDLRGRGRGTAAGRVAVAAGMGSRVKTGARPEKPRRLPPAPAWVTGADTITAFPSVGGAGASIAAAWSPVAGAAAYRVEVDAPSGVTVFSAEVPATILRVEMHGAPPGRYRARVATVDAERFEGRPAPELELTVVGVTVSTPGSPVTAAAVPDDYGDLPLSTTAPSVTASPIVAQGTALGDGTLTCTSGSASGAPLRLDTVGRTTVACFLADGRAVAPFALEVAPITASTAAGASPVAVTRGGHQEITIRLDSAVALGNQWRVDPGPGLTCEGFQPVDEGVTIRVGIDAAAPAATTLDVLDDRTGGRVATVAVTVEDPPPLAPSVPERAKRVVWESGGAVVPRRTHVTAGAFAGWTAFPAGMTDGLELGDTPVSAYQIDSGAGAGMRASLWLRRELFVELEAGLWPTGFVAAEEPAWVTSGHALVGYQLVDGARLGGRAVVGAGGYALLGDASYARADVDPDATWGLTGTFRLDRDLSLRLDGRHRIAPDRADAGVTDVFEVTIGIEAVVTRTSASR